MTALGSAKAQTQLSVSDKSLTGLCQQNSKGACSLWAGGVVF